MCVRAERSELERPLDPFGTAGRARGVEKVAAFDVFESPRGRGEFLDRARSGDGTAETEQERRGIRRERTYRFDCLRGERLFDEQRLGAAVRQNVADLPRLQVAADGRVIETGPLRRPGRDEKAGKGLCQGKNKTVG